MKANLKSEALAAYERAASQPDGADWRAVAELLRAAFPSARDGGKAARARALSDYSIGDYRKVMLPAPVIVVEYADGQRVRMSFASLPGKPFNVGHGLRVAEAAYQSRARRKSDRVTFEKLTGRPMRLSDLRVPAVVAAHVEHAGEVHKVNLEGINVSA